MRGFHRPATGGRIRQRARFVDAAAVPGWKAAAGSAIAADSCGAILRGPVGVEWIRRGAFAGRNFTQLNPDQQDKLLHGLESALIHLPGTSGNERHEAAP